MVTYNYDDDVFELTEQLGTQKISLRVGRYDETQDTIYYNISLVVYSKRKHIDASFDNIESTGKNPFQTGIKAIHMYKEMEKAVLENERNQGWKIKFVVFWTDNRRRNVYERALKPFGYSFNREINGWKCLMKTVEN